ncbi:MAG: ATP-binding protein [Opitutales bacterium]
MKAALLLAVMAACFCRPAAASPAWGSPLIKSFTSAELGTDDAGWSITQGKDGEMFFGSNRLLTFDGERWRHYGIGSSYAIRSMDFAPDGRLWAGATNELGWYEPNPDGRLAYHSLVRALPVAEQGVGEIWAVYATANGAVFVARDRIYLWDGRHFQIWRLPTEKRLFATRFEGRIYVQQKSVGLLQVTSHGPETEIPASAIGNEAVFWMGRLNGNLALVTSGGIKRLGPGNKVTLCAGAATDYIRSNRLTSVIQLPDGSLAIGTLRAGLVVISQDLAIRNILTSANGLHTNEIISLFEDREGDLWAGSTTGIDKIELSSAVSIYTHANGLPAGSCYGIATPNDQPTVIAGNRILQISGAEPAENSGRFLEIGVNQVHYYDLAAAAGGLVAAYSTGIDLITAAGTQPLLQTGTDVFRVIPSVTDHATILAAVGQSILRVNTRNGAHEVVVSQLPDNPDTLIEQPNGSLWIGTGSKGLLASNPEAGSGENSYVAAKAYGFPYDQGHTQVCAVAGLVVGVGPAGAWWLDPNSNRFQPVAEFPAGTAAAVSNADAQGRVWVALEGVQSGLPPRLGQLVRTAAGVQWLPRSIAGLATAGLPRALHVQTTAGGNVLWIAGSAALLRVEHPETMTAQPPPQPLLRAWVHGPPGSPDQPVARVLPYRTRRLHLEFGSTAYALRDTLRYQTLVEGVDHDWSAPTNSAEQELANLREGDYTFKVRLVADTGLVSPPAELHFRIAAPWWRTPGAYAGYAAALALVLTGLYRLRLRTLRQRAAQLEETVRQRTAELEKANAAKTEFVASMSHEIRNPMNGIIGSATALADTPLNAEQQELVTTLRHCAGFLASLVEDVLDFSSIEAGVFTVNREPCHPAEILETVAAMLVAPAAEAGAHFDLEVDPKLPARFLGDPARIQQIVVNYATNALKFSGGGRVRLSAYVDNGFAAFAVSDDGPGISPEDQAVLFTRFSRLKTARNAGVPGAGLGLAVCRAVAERMQGSVGVASVPGRGATFFLRVPLTPAGTAPGPVRPEVPSLEGALVLVVEDLDYNARSLGAMLRKLGCTVDFARNGEEALLHLAKSSYRAVFLDYDLPDMSGLEVARRLRAHETAGSHTLVVATTAYSTVQDRDACLAAGMDVFLGKPITPEKLHATLSGLHLGPLPAPSVHLPVEPAPALNLRLLVYLAGGQAGALEREIGRYTASLAGTHGEVLAALTMRDRPGLRRAAHRLCSHARMIEASALDTLARDLEAKADYADDATLQRLGGKLAAAIASLTKALARHRPTPEPA